MRLINLTPHPITLRGKNAEVTIAPSGTIARVVTTEDVIDSVFIDGTEVPVVRTRYGRLEGVPAPEKAIGYIVSSLAAQAAPERDDLFVPCQFVRDEQGRIIAAQALSRI